MRKPEFAFLIIIFAALTASITIAYYFVSWVIDYPEAALQVVLTLLMSILIFALILRILHDA